MSYSRATALKKAMPHHKLLYKKIVEEIVNWYAINHVIFPWREQHDAYHVWVSEVMLQQTTVKTVIDYYVRFMERFPDVFALAKANLDEVLSFWQGLGYYRRAHQLHKASNIIVTSHKGQFPKLFDDIRSLPGIGDYTAAAIAAISYKNPHVPVDGNVCRVFSRLFAIENTVKELPKILQSYVREFENVLALNALNPSFFAQGLMDLGREVCTPKNPKCQNCPVQSVCSAYSQELTDVLPLKDIKQIIPTRYAQCHIYRRSDEILIQKRDEKGLLGGLWQFPISDFQNKQKIPDDVGVDTNQHFLDIENVQSVKENKNSSKTQEFISPKLIGEVRHVFSHFKLIVRIFEGDPIDAPSGCWAKIKDLKHYALPTLMKKILETCYQK